MQEVIMPNSVGRQIEQRTKQLLEEQQQYAFKEADRVFCGLLISEWLACIFLSLWLSPLVWAGRFSDVHIHVFTAICLGGLIVIPPACLALKHPGKVTTRYTISIAQMLISALLIHLTGGRLETHFHVFVSLAFLAFYRDWRILIPASIVVALDHLLRGLFFPQSVYGVSVIEPMRWLEHAGWVVFEDVILIKMCLMHVEQMKLGARREAEIEEINNNIEQQVKHRTEQLNSAGSWAKMQYEVVQALGETGLGHDAIEKFLDAILAHVARNGGRAWAGFWTCAEGSAELKCTESRQASDGDFSNFDKKCHSLMFQKGSGIPGRRWESLDAKIVSINEPEFSRSPDLRSAGLNGGVAFSVSTKGQFFGVIEIFTENETDWDLDALKGLGTQIAQASLKKEIENDWVRLAKVVALSNDAILTLAANNCINSCNNGAEKMLNIEASKVLGKDISVLYEGGAAPEFNTLFQNLRNGSAVNGYEISLPLNQNRSIDVLLYMVPWFDDQEDYVGCSLTIHNISERKEAQRNVAEFYSIVSHELRTPLTSIRGVLGLIENGTVEPASEEAHELIGVARASSDRLIRLINDMLDLKKIEAGKMELNQANIDSNEVVLSSLSALSGMAVEAGVQLECSCPSGLSIYAEWDKVVQIITNLVSNAIKFSPPNSVVRVIAEPSGSKTVRFRIIDDGPGIAPDDKSRLFQKFQQLDSTDSRPVGGTGLGLAITKALVEEHGGRIGLNSEHLKGAEFWFELPMTAVPMCMERANYKLATVGKSLDRVLANKHKSTILIVDDDDDLRKILCAQIRDLGVVCLEARNGREAIELIHQNLPDILLLDLIMPELDGFGVIDVLRHDQSANDLPIIVYSCKDLCRAERELLVLGVTRFLMKGEATQLDLNETISELLHHISPLALTA